MIRALRRRGSSRSRSGAGAVTRIALIWLIARVRLSVAESLAHLKSRIISTFSPPDFGITVAEPEIQDLAAASSSMASSLPSRRRVERSGAVTSTTGKPASTSSWQSPAPKEPLPSMANRGAGIQHSPSLPPLEARATAAYMSL